MTAKNLPQIFKSHFHVEFFQQEINVNVVLPWKMSMKKNCKFCLRRGGLRFHVCARGTLVQPPLGVHVLRENT